MISIQGKKLFSYSAGQQILEYYVLHMYCICLYIYCMSCISTCRLYLHMARYVLRCGYDYARAHTKGAIFVVILIDLIFLIDRKTKGQIQNIVIHMKQVGSGILLRYDKDSSSYIKPPSWNIQISHVVCILHQAHSTWYIWCYASNLTKKTKGQHIYTILFLTANILLCLKLPIRNM